MCTLWCIWMQHGGGENKQCLNFANCMHTWLQTTELRQGSSQSGSLSVEAQQLLCAVLICSWCEVKYITFKILSGYTGWYVLLCSGPVAHNRHASHQLWLAANTALHVSVGSLLVDAGGCPIPGAGKPHRADQQGCAQHPYSDFPYTGAISGSKAFIVPSQSKPDSQASWAFCIHLTSPPHPDGASHRPTESTYTGAFPPLLVLLFCKIWAVPVAFSRCFPVGLLKDHCPSSAGAAGLRSRVPECKTCCVCSWSSWESAAVAVGKTKLPFWSRFQFLVWSVKGTGFVQMFVCLSVHPYGDPRQFWLKAASLKLQRVPLGAVAVGIPLEERPPGGLPQDGEPGGLSADKGTRREHWVGTWAG